MTSIRTSRLLLVSLLATPLLPGCLPMLDGEDVDDDATDESTGAGEESSASSSTSATTTGSTTSDEGPQDSGSDDESSSGGETGEPGDALGDSVFVYVHADADAADSVRAYDVDTDETWLVTDFDGSSEISGVAIHPDRTTLAVASDYDLGGAFESESIFSVSAAGGEPELIMDAFPGEAGQTQSIGSLVWSSDGAHVYFDHATYANMVGGATIARVAGSGGLPELFVTSNGSCQLSTSPSPSPDNSLLLGVRENCVDSEDVGVVAYAVPPADAGQMLVALASSEATLVSPRWLPDGSGVLLVADFPVDADMDGQSDGSGSALLLLDIAANELYTVLPAELGAYYWSFALSPDGTRVVLSIAIDGVPNLVLADLGADPITFRGLTGDGASTEPAW